MGPHWWEELFDEQGISGFADDDDDDSQDEDWQVVDDDALASYLVEQSVAESEPEARAVRPPSVVVPSSSTQSGPQLRPVGEALSGTLPIFLVHKGARHANRLPSLVRDVQAALHASLSVAVSVKLPRGKPAAVSTFLQRCGSASIRIADPELYASPPDPLEGITPARQYAEDWPYLSREMDDSVQWVAEILEAQRSVGANLLLTPSRWMPGIEPDAELAQAVTVASHARAGLGPGEHLAVNMTLGSNWLLSDRLLERLLHEIVESSETVFHLRVRWAPIIQPHGQLLDRAMLAAYRSLCGLAEDEEKTLLLPNTDVTGWMSLAWGATGFGTGIGPSDRTFAEARRFGRRADQEWVPPVPRYFEPDLLHTVDRDAHGALADLPGYNACPCRYCEALRSLPADQWSPELAGLHYLKVVADRTAALMASRQDRPPNRRAVARRLVREAIEYRDEVAQSAILTADTGPRHLSIWSDLLA